MMRKFTMRGLIGCVMLLAATCLGQVTWQVGDVFVAVGNGYQVWRNSGNGYVQIDSFSAGSSSGLTGGCAFDSQFNFYASNSSGQVLEFNNSNHTPAVTINTPSGMDPRSITFDASGIFYVGSSFSSTVGYTPMPPSNDTGPNPVPIDYNSPTTISSFPQAADQLDLGTDQTSLFFTSANPAVKNNPSFLTRLDLTNPGNNTVTGLGGTAWAVRLLAPANINPGPPLAAINGLLVADDSSVLQLDSSGNKVNTFSIKGGKHSFRFLGLDPDGQTFWVGDFGTGNVYRVSLANLKLVSGNTLSTGSNTSTNPMGGVCVFGGQQLNIVPLQFPQGNSVTQVAAFGDPEIDPATGQPKIDPNNPPAPDSPDYHIWSGTVDQVLSPFTLVLSATAQGPQPAIPLPGSPLSLLDRFDEYFCNQAEAGHGPFGCFAGLPGTGPTLVPIPYTDQFLGANGVPTVSGTGTAIGLNEGNRVVYRVQNPPTNSQFSGNFNVAIHFKQPPACASITQGGGTVIGPTGFTTSSNPNCYIPPECTTGFWVSSPRFMNDPSQPPFDTDHEFAFDSSLNFLLDTGVTGSGGRNDHVVADRCPQINSGAAAFAQAVFNSPVPKSKVTKGSSVPVKVTVTDANGNPVTTCVSSPNNMTVVVTDQFGNLEEATQRSFDFFTQNGGGGGTYSGNLDTSGLATGQTTICVTSVNEVNNAGTGSSGQFPPICTQFTIR